MAKNDRSYIDALKKYAHSDNVKFSTVFAGLRKESDRALVVITGSMVEDALGSVIKAAFREPANHKERNDLWGSQGLFGTFSAKIKIAYALSIIDRTMRDRLDILREMRNACAHSQMPIDFDTPELAVACENFLHEKYDPVFPILHPDRQSRRRAFYGETLSFSADFQDEADRRLNALAPLLEKLSRPTNPIDHPKSNER